MAVKPPRLSPLLMTLALAGALSAAGSAAAQTMTSNAASFNAGWGRTADQENRAVDPNTRDANGNRVIIDGVIMNSSNQSLFSGGAASASAGASVGGATAIGNSLTVITQGDDNIVIVDSRQINNGSVTATSSTSGAGGNGS